MPSLNLKSAVPHINGVYFSFNVFGIPKPKDILALSIMDMLPDSFARFIVRNAPSPRFEVGRRTNKLTTRVAKQLVAEKYAALKEGKASKDLMSLMGSDFSCSIGRPHSLTHYSQSQRIWKPRHAPRGGRTSRSNEVCIQLIL